jgi:hypothetical protein
MSGWLVVLLLCSGAILSDALRDPQKAFVGEWRALEFKSNLREFSGVTNFAFIVYAVEIFDTKAPPPPDLWAQLVAEFVVTGQDGKERLPYLCYPMELWGTNTLHAGPFMDGMLFRYAFTNGLLVLERKQGEDYFFARLKRTHSETGQPKFLPSWERNHLRSLREQQAQ